jgi:hypothetical protein
MLKLILTILIISNISAGIEIATDLEDVWAEFGGAMIATDLQLGFADGGNSSHEEEACDHCCHGVAHFSGVVVSCITLPYISTSLAIHITDTLYYFTSLSPPTPPPNA